MIHDVVMGASIMANSGLKKSWVYETPANQEFLEEVYGNANSPTLSPRSLGRFAERQAELEQYSISASGDMDRQTFDEWPRMSVASQTAPLKIRKKMHIKKHRTASFRNDYAMGSTGTPATSADTIFNRKADVHSSYKDVETEISIKTVDDLKRYLVRIGKLDPKELDSCAPPPKF